MKIAICAIIKNENLYLREWVEHHKRIGFDKIILYDNNPVDGEVPHQVIGDYVMEGYVDIYNIRGLEWIPKNSKNIYVNYPKHWGNPTIQVLSYTKCMLDYQKEYQWIAYIDIDEFITISPDEPQDVHKIFEKYQYIKNGFKQVVMSWQNIGDDGKTCYENNPVQERFVHPCNYSEIAPISDIWVKSIICTDFISPEDAEKKVIHAHAINTKTCTTTCQEIYGFEHYGYTQINIPVHRVMYIKHYFSKSLWEHVSRCRNLIGQGMVSDNRISSYKELNGWSDKHEKVLQNYISYINNPEKMV